MQQKVLAAIHSGHQGIVKCRRRAKESVWWLGLSSQIENLIRNCSNCIQERSNPKESFKTENPPIRPWQRLGADLFKHGGKWYLIVVDYFSRYIEIAKLSSLSEKTIIERITQLFSRHGISEELVSDNGPKFRNEFKKFAEEYYFRHITSSPYFSQSNGEAEAAVKIAKQLIKKNGSDCNQLAKALLSYRSTRLANGFSPAEMLMNRKLRTEVPTLPSALKGKGK
ncbi:uncharacterized protein K02A2.6-like, partial [Belonocnema kinseyi]|uniref:uncharacterized protein K02A2.6-like n=1 Tax=Belonocnema kinseyi TaxID=2817044 RepID=UPI00143DA622